MKIMKCVYCGNKIMKESKEHIIHNALGGQAESVKICCGLCNNKVREIIDNPFCEMFNPIISKIDNFTKTNNTKSSPSCRGKARYINGKTYDVTIKNGKVVDCITLKKELRRNLTKEEFEEFIIESYYFNMDNNALKNGISKIAFNFALENDVDRELIKDYLHVKKKNEVVEEIKFNNPVIPFVPLNPFDEYIELNASFELYHNLILFNEENYLWCYVDLFNTFQYYVLLSDKWNEDTICKTYLQHMQKIDRTVPEISIRRTKDILVYAAYYNIEPTMDLGELKKRVTDAINKESLKKNMANIISDKLGFDYMNGEKIKSMNPIESSFYLKSLWLYMDEDDYLREEVFRQKTVIMENSQNAYSYPLLIIEGTKNNTINIKNYTFPKFERLSRYLMKWDAIEQEAKNKYL